MPDHLTPVTSDRGFDSLPSIPATWAGQPAGEVSVSESSAASGPHIWLDVKEEILGQNSRTCVQLRVDDARKLAEQILWLAEHHYQGDNPL